VCIGECAREQDRVCESERERERESACVRQREGKRIILGSMHWCESLKVEEMHV